LLGDAVLNLLVTDFLTSRYPAANVAFLSDLKSKMISGSVLAELFRYEKMYSFFPIPFPEKLKLSDKVISGAFEAFLGTAYLLFGLDKVQDYLFVLLPEWEKTS